jgi:CBS domain-containing protein
METEIPRDITSAIDRHPLITTPDTLMPEAIALMSQVRYGCILVVAAREGARFPLGILTEQDVVHLIAAQTDLSDLPISGVMNRQLITVREEQAEDIMVLTHLLRKHKNRHFPVVSDRGNLIGLVTPQSIRNILKPVDLFRLKQVQEAISELVIHASIETSLQEVIQLMSQQSSNCVVITHSHRTRENRVPESRVPESRVPESRVPESRVPESRVPENRVPENRVPENRVEENRVEENRVEENRVEGNRVPENRVEKNRVEKNRIVEDGIAENNPLIPVGIITEWDILQFYRRGLDLAKTTAGLVMSTPLLLVKLTDSMWTAHQIMQRLGVRRLVVSNAQGELAGVITHAGILMEIDPLEIHQTVSTLKHLVNEQTTRLTVVNNQLNIDINEGKLLEQKLASSENQLRAIVEAITDVILTINLKNDQLGSIDIAPVNEKLGDEYRLAIVNETIQTFFYGDVDWLRRVRRVLATASSEQFDYALEVDGQCMWFAVNISPISGNSAVWVARDISKQQAVLNKFRSAETALNQIHQIHVDLAQALAEIQQAKEPARISVYHQTQEQKILNLINHGLYFSQPFSREID